MIADTDPVGVASGGDFARVDDYVDGFFMHRRQQAADEWAEDCVYLPKKVADLEGPFRWPRVAWGREIVASVNDPDCSSGAFVCGTQSTKTTLLKLINLYGTIVLRVNCVWLWPNRDLAGSFSLTKLRPTIEASEKLLRYIPSNSDLFKNLEMHFEGGGTLNFVGSHSKVNAKSRSAGIVSSDEIDDCAAKTEDDADPITLLDERTKTFIGAKKYRFGSPTIPSRPAWQNYLLGDQRHYFLPCPQCGIWQSLELRDQVFVLEGITGPLSDRREPLPVCTSSKTTGRAGEFHLRWEADARIGDRDWDFDRVAATARYHCVACDAVISQREKNDLVETESCRWFPTVRAKSEGARSWRLPALYPLWPGTTFAKNATKFLQTHHTIAGEQSYFNNWRALPYGRGHDTADRAALLKLASLIFGAHAMGERVGEKTALVVDVQRHHVWWAWFGFTGDGMHLIDCNSARDPEAAIAKGDELGVDFGAMDSRHRAQEVYAAVHSRREKWIAIRGEKTGSSLKAKEDFDPFTGEREQGVFQITLLHLNTYAWGEELLARLYPPKEAADSLPDFARVERPSLDPEKALDQKLPRFRDFFTPRDFFARAPHMVKQLYNESIIEYLDAKGKLVRKWTENKDNHLFDITKYAMALASYRGLTRFQSDAAAKLAAAVAALPKQPELPLSEPRGGKPLYNS